MEKVVIGNAELWHGDCLEVMPLLSSVDMIAADLPYGTTACSWDSVIPFEPLWREYRRLCKGAIVLTAAQPFTSALVMSNSDEFKYTWVWDKLTKTNHLNAKKQPLRRAEDVCVFYRQQPTYNPQGLLSGLFDNWRDNHSKYNKGDKVIGVQKKNTNQSEFTNYPDDILCFSNGNFDSQHPTQKPVSLFEYLLNTYTNAGMTVLDNTMGSGTTGVAAMNLRRNFIGIEKEQKYFEIACKRIEQAQQQLQLGL